MIYIFDVDGTLTPSRGRMNDEFAEFFDKFVSDHECYLITGSDRDKTLEQIPKEILKEYNSKVPFVKELTKRVSNFANSEGYVSTIKGRKCRFELWEPTTFGVFKALPEDQAKLNMVSITFYKELVLTKH